MNRNGVCGKVRELLKQVEATAPLNSWITVDEEGALAKAESLDAATSSSNDASPLRGMVMGIKDNIAVKSMPQTFGTPSLRSYHAKEDATVVKRLRDADVVILGKTNLHELCFGITSNNHAFGGVGNAHNPLLFAGGSSGGTATAIAAGSIDAGLGSDTGGSVRIPAALCGVVGFRPTVGRYSSDGVMRLSSTRDTVGPLAKTVADVIRIDSVLAENGAGSSTVEAADLSAVRLGVPRRHFYEDLDPSVEAATNSVLQSLRAAGVDLVEADLVDVPELANVAGFPIVLYETRLLLKEWLAANKPELELEQLWEQVASPDVKQVIGKVVNDPVPEDVYREAMEVKRPALKKAYADYFSSHKVDAVIFPTTPLVSRPLADSDETVTTAKGETVPTFPTFIRNTDPCAVAGIAGLTIPSGMSEDGWPIGIEIDGPEGSDDRLLSIGLAVEEVIGTKK